MLCIKRNLNILKNDRQLWVCKKAADEYAIFQVSKIDLDFWKEHKTCSSTSVSPPEKRNNGGQDNQWH